MTIQQISFCDFIRGYVPADVFITKDKGIHKRSYGI